MMTEYLERFGLDKRLAESQELHTLRLPEPVQSSTGLVHEYVDAIAMLLCWKSHLQAGLTCEEVWKVWWEQQLRGLGGYAREDNILGMGTGGMAVVATLRAWRIGAKHSVLRAPYKTHGLKYNGDELVAGDGVVLVDDVAATGESMRLMRDWCHEYGIVVLKEIVMVDLREATAR